MDRLADVQLALQQGNKLLARKLLSQALLSDPRSEQAWLLLARLADTEEQVIECLERALRINPEKATTTRALRLLKGKALNRAASSISQAKPAFPQPIKPGVAEIRVRTTSDQPPVETFAIVAPNGREAAPPPTKTH